MSLYKQKGSQYWWYSFVFNGKRIQASTKVTNRREAETIEAAKRVQLAKQEVGIEPPPPKPKPRSVGELLDDLKADYELRGKGSTGNLSLFNVVKREFGTIMADKLTADDVTSYIARKRKEKLADSTLANHFQILTQAFTHAKLTPPDVPKLTCDNVRSGFLSPAQFEVLRSHLPDDLKDFALFAYLTGWRKGAIQKLEWSDVRESKVYLRAKHSKNGRPYFVPVNDDLKKLLERREAARAIEGRGSRVTLCSLVFHRDGLPVNDFDKAWGTARTKADCEGLLFHDLRRSAARNLRRSGVPESVAMRVTGHETNSMFRRYSIVDEVDLTEAMEKVAKYNEAERAKVVAIAK